MEGQGPSPLLFGEHHLGTCWKSQFSSSIPSLLKGLAVTAGTPGGGGTIKNFKVVTTDHQAKCGLLVRGGPVHLPGSQTAKPALPVERASGRQAGKLCFRNPSGEVCYVGKFENVHAEPAFPPSSIERTAG